MLTRSMRRILAVSRRLTFAILGLSVLAMFAVQPASANTYSFVMPVSALEIRLDASFGGNPQLYGFYDLYIRPKITADGTDNDGTTGNIIVDFSLRADDAPITPRGTQDAWSANITTRSGLPNFYFSAAAPGDAYIALITPNAAVAGKKIGRAHV